MVPDITFKDYLEICNLGFEWADCYDAKDWNRLRKLMAPSIRLDSRTFHRGLHESLSPEEYIAIVSDKKRFGDIRLKSQHLLGGSQWTGLDDGKVGVLYQVRAAHQRYKAEDLAEVTNKGHGHGTCHYIYEKINGTWKIAGVKPTVHWSEDDMKGTVSPPEV